MEVWNMICRPIPMVSQGGDLGLEAGGSVSPKEVGGLDGRAPVKRPSLKRDIWNVVLLVVLCKRLITTRSRSSYLHLTPTSGVPNGLATGSIPFLLKEKLSYAQLATFSLVGYPYSLKLLWSPIVDSAYLRGVGRRKTWIVPIQALSAALLYWLSSNVASFLDNDPIDVGSLTCLFTLLVFLSATQVWVRAQGAVLGNAAERWVLNIAVDGWALTLLSEENLSYASTCQTVGLTTGYFLSFTIFLALSSPEFCNTYLRSASSEVGVVTLSAYLMFWAFGYALVTAYLVLFKTEARDGPHQDMNISETYRTIVEICRLPHIRSLVGVLLVCKVGFICNEAVTSLKLLDRGFKKEDLALIALIDFPFQIVFGFYAAKWSIGPRPLKPWLYAIFGRLFFSLVGSLVVMAYPAGGVNLPYFLLVIVVGVLTSFTSTVQFVGISAFFSQIADPYIGGTYMTFLNTLSNLGGTWPKYFVLEAVEYFTVARCSVGEGPGQALACASDKGKRACEALGGQCAILRDGYYFVNTLTILFSILLFATFLLPLIHRLEGNLLPCGLTLQSSHPPPGESAVPNDGADIFPSGYLNLLSASA
ncbi:hypothetical protein L0F63_007248 [Massospora cicadina]|nr:hypothetical protein L0F63_007248 [Massospora cicadina]